MSWKKIKLPDRAICPVCGEYEFKAWGTYEICPVCHWENDETQVAFPDEYGANGVTLQQARIAWRNWCNKTKDDEQP